MKEHNVWKRIEISLFVVFLICFIESSICSAQGGVGLYAGYTTAYSQDNQFRKPNQAQFGYHLGASARLNDDEFHFLLGAEFHRFDLIPNTNPTPFKDGHMTMLKLRGGFGLNFLKFGKNGIMRTKIMGSLNFIQDYNRQLLDTPGYQTLNENQAGVVTGLGIDFGKLTIDLEYEYGLFNVFFMKPDTKLNFINLSFGVFL